jgi:hypothetical protein
MEESSFQRGQLVEWKQRSPCEHAYSKGKSPPRFLAATRLDFEAVLSGFSLSIEVRAHKSAAASHNHGDNLARVG